MNGTRLFFVVLYVAIAALQAWDADVLKAPAHIQAMVAAAIALPAAAYALSRDTRAHFAAVAISGVLVIIARFTSPVRHGELFMVAWLAFLFLLLEGIAKRNREAKDSNA